MTRVDRNEYHSLNTVLLEFRYTCGGEVKRFAHGEEFAMEKARNEGLRFAAIVNRTSRRKRTHDPQNKRASMSFRASNSEQHPRPMFHNLSRLTNTIRNSLVFGLQGGLESFQRYANISTIVVMVGPIFHVVRVVTSNCPASPEVSTIDGGRALIHVVTDLVGRKLTKAKNERKRGVSKGYHEDATRMWVGILKRGHR